MDEREQKWTRMDENVLIFQKDLFAKEIQKMGLSQKCDGSNNYTAQWSNERVKHS